MMMYAWMFNSNATLTCPHEIVTKLNKTIDLPFNTSYFMRASPATREVTFATSGSEPSQLLNVDTGKMTPLDGSIDPVLSPDGRILAIPENVIFDGHTGSYRAELKSNPPISNGYIIGFSTVEKITNGTLITSSKTIDQVPRKNTKLQLASTMVLYTRDKSGQPQLSYVDEKSRGNYQSIGLLRKNAQESQYRMAYQGDSGMYIQQYSLAEGSSKITPVGGNRPLCSANATMALPILSHDGSRVSFYDVDRQQTVIMSVNEAGNCNEIGAIPGLIGKPDFSPDNQSLVFHVDEAINVDNVVFDAPNKDQKLGIYAYDLKSKRLSAVVNDNSVDSYYPVFLSNNEIAYIEAQGRDKDQHMKIKLMNFNRNAGYRCRDCESTPELRQASAVLGVLYGRSCGFQNLNLGNSVIGLSRLTPDACREFLNSLSDEKIAAVQTELETSTKWDPGHDKEFAKENKYDVTKRPPRPRIAKTNLTDICGRLDQNGEIDSVHSTQ